MKNTYLKIIIIASVLSGVLYIWFNHFNVPTPTQNISDLKESATTNKEALNVIEETPSAEIVKDSAISWKKFKSNKYGYEISYPESAEYAIRYYAGDEEKNKITRVSSNTYAVPDPEEADSVNIGWGPNSFFEIDFLDNKEKNTLTDFIKNDIDNDNPNNKLSFGDIQSNGTDYLLDNKKAYKFETNRCCLSSYKLIQGNQVFVYFTYDDTTIGRIAYHLTNPNDDHAEEHKNLFQKMLTTFKFIN